jgi:hypothetical protein
MLYFRVSRDQAILLAVDRRIHCNETALHVNRPKRRRNHQRGAIIAAVRRWFWANTKDLKIHWCCINIVARENNIPIHDTQLCRYAIDEKRDGREIKIDDLRCLRVGAVQIIQRQL